MDSVKNAVLKMQLFLKTDECPDIQKDIDTQVSKQAKRLLDNIRFGMEKKIDFSTIQTILTLKDMLYMCNQDVNLIKTLLRVNLNKFC